MWLSADETVLNVKYKMEMLNVKYYTNFNIFAMF